MSPLSFSSYLCFFAAHNANVKSLFHVYRIRAASKVQGEAPKKPRTRDRPRGIPAPEANAEMQSNIDVRMIIFNDQYYARLKLLHLQNLGKEIHWIVVLSSM